MTDRRVQPLLRVCICGGGNLGHALAGILGANPTIEVRVLTRRTSQWQRHLSVYYKRKVLCGRVHQVSQNAADVVTNSDIVLLAVPAFGRKEVLEKLHHFVSPATFVGSFPGTECFDLLARSVLGSKCKVFGVQRSPYICRIVEYGRSVRILGIRPSAYLATLPIQYGPELSRLLSSALNLLVRPLANYLEVTLTPGNAIFHPSRLYSLFKNWRNGEQFVREMYFYRDWDNEATELYLACDNEIQAIVTKLGLQQGGVTPLLTHYQATTAQEITDQIRSSLALNTIRAPLRKITRGYGPNFSHRFFVEDIGYGLQSLAAIAELAKVEAPTISTILRWGRQHILSHSKQWSAVLEDHQLPLPKNYGIKSVEQLRRRSVH